MTHAEARARLILGETGLSPDQPLELVKGNWSNHVWIGADHVLRVSRHDPAWLAHEVQVAACLPLDVPYPGPLSSGVHEGSVWVLAPRIEAQPLYAAWVDTTSIAGRSRLIASLAAALRALHRVELPAHLASPASRGGGPPVSPSDFPALVRDFLRDTTARGVVTESVASAARAIVEEASLYLQGGRVGTVHTDLTFANALWDGSQVWLLDLEYACTAPIDYELADLLRYCWDPRGSVPEEWEDVVAASDQSVVPSLLVEHYPELFEVAGLELRLIVYGLASFARGWLIRPDLWASPALAGRSSAALADFVSRKGWTRLVPA